MTTTTTKPASAANGKAPKPAAKATQPKATQPKATVTKHTKCSRCGYTFRAPELVFEFVERPGGSTPYVPLQQEGKGVDGHRSFHAMSLAVSARGAIGGR